jgi:hypothetical protein
LGAGVRRARGRALADVDEQRLGHEPDRRVGERGDAGDVGGAGDRRAVDADGVANPRPEAALEHEQLAAVDDLHLADAEQRVGEVGDLAHEREAGATALVVQEAQARAAVGGCPVGRERALHRRPEVVAVRAQPEALEREVARRLARRRDREAVGDLEGAELDAVAREVADHRLGLRRRENRAVGKRHEALAVEVPAGVRRAVGAPQRRDRPDGRREVAVRVEVEVVEAGVRRALVVDERAGVLAAAQRERGEAADRGRVEGRLVQRVAERHQVGARAAGAERRLRAGNRGKGEHKRAGDDRCLQDTGHRGPPRVARPAGYQTASRPRACVVLVTRRGRDARRRGCCASPRRRAGRRRTGRGRRRPS